MYICMCEFASVGGGCWERLQQALSSARWPHKNLTQDSANEQTFYCLLAQNIRPLYRQCLNYPFQLIERQTVCWECYITYLSFFYYSITPLEECYKQSRLWNNFFSFFDSCESRSKIWWRIWTIQNQGWSTQINEQLPCLKLVSPFYNERLTMNAF